MRHGPGQLHSAQFEVLRRGDETGAAKRIERLLHLRDDVHASAFEARLVEVRLAVVRREFILGDLRRRLQRGVEGLARVLREARLARQRLDVQQFVENEFQVPAVEQLRLHSKNLSSKLFKHEGPRR